MDTNSRNRLIKSASYLSVTTALIILSIKLYAWVVTDSQSILASLIDSMLDITSSFINLIALRFALQPPDHHHRFGYEKMQDLTIFSQSIFFFASAFFVGFSSVKSLFEKTKPENISDGTTVMYVCIFLTIILVLYQTYVIKKTGSEIVKADKLHYFTDLLTNVIVIISINLSDYFWFVDPLFGVVISLYIFHSSYSLFKKAFKNLVDHELPEQDRQKIISIVNNHLGAKGMHEMKTRYAGQKAFIQCHLEMDGNMSLYNAHKISDEIAFEILQEFPEAEIIIHQDPFGIEEHVNYREYIVR
ncbi:cation-efflux pump [Rickettsia conorii subsp. heilongjiangensis]|uniref:Protein p34 n=2 Tax=spotted fever group TaxID=114277 RepID=A0AAD1GJU8_RICCR|nr:MULTISPECIES: cation diffusion facilitator family transporter [spotted fever group]AEK75247.1 CzcD [Rickettsia conorii subsp. heilongjiangensis 054]KJW04685.1 cation diffusion facilitator transporter family protein [Rickettsia argasii T170-B]UZW38619.1 cation diffusion facilitator family transporter [Rickettsia conorii subsp. heilongjiangensis]BBM91977.1 cation-efflux pump [Rickettsia conorii subsp. heilongjiangensis]BBM93186.1 cation-efflux pump [Rickettsia conorii subsp. heilongjiangensis